MLVVKREEWLQVFSVFMAGNIAKYGCQRFEDDWRRAMELSIALTNDVFMYEPVIVQLEALGDDGAHKQRDHDRRIEAAQDAAEIEVLKQRLQKSADVIRDLDTMLQDQRKAMTEASMVVTKIIRGFTLDFYDRKKELLSPTDVHALEAFANELSQIAERLSQSEGSSSKPEANKP